MTKLYLGNDMETGEKIRIQSDILRTHLHLIGATGAGKTTAILTLLHPLMIDPFEKAALFVIDPMGNLSQDLLRMIASNHCPQHVRDRLVYIEPAREDVVLPFNPLTHTSEGNRYYQTMRAIDIVLRAWAATDVTQQPRLLQWLYKSFCAAAIMGLPISMCRYLVHPGTAEHEAILRQLPDEVSSHWMEILNARGSEAVRILESTRNRLDPFFESLSLRRMFGCTTSHFDCERFIRERRIVILNVAKYGRLPGFIGDTIGALALNEIMETASRLTTTFGRSLVEPTYILMDEFQKFVGVDIEDALPTVRQMGLRLILAHQSFAQLEREDIDLTQMIWQARSRLVFANNARDADIVADELAKLTFNPRVIKDTRRSKKQLIVGYRKEWLESTSSSRSSSRADANSNSTGYTHSSSETAVPGRLRSSESEGQSDQRTSGFSHTYTDSCADTSGRSETNVPIHDTFSEISNITFQNYDEFAVLWGQKIRHLRTGEAYGLFAGDNRIREMSIDHVPIVGSPQLEESVARLKERNFASEWFLSGDEADRQSAVLRTKLLRGEPLTVSSCENCESIQDSSAPAVEASKVDSPFR